MLDIKAVLPGWRAHFEFLALKSARACAVLFAACATFAPNALESAAANGDTRTLYLYHSHSKESIAATFRVDGHYDSATLEKLNWFLRDWRNDEPTKMDPRLFDVLWEAYRSTDRMGPDDPIVVVSAYRCPATNAMLRRRSRAVAEHSQHMLGKAMDTTMPGLSMEKLREVGMRMQRGGVGYYPRANTPFVHLDVGGVRHWPRMNYDQLARLFPDGKTVHIPSNGKLLPGYEEARAEILARGGEAISVAEATSSGGGLRGFFAALFGGGGEDEEDARQSVPVKPTRVASRNPRAQQEPEGGDAEAGDVRDDPQRRLMAKAETDLPRGETYMGAPPETAAAAPAPVRAPLPAPAPAVAPESRATAAPLKPGSLNPADEPAQAQVEAEKPHPLDDAPLPPRRPPGLEPELADMPLPPPRPVGLAALPTVITQGAGAARQGLRPSSDGNGPLAYATASEPRHENTTDFTPLPPRRPPAPALRSAAAARVEQGRAAAPLAPARLDRSGLGGAATPAAQPGKSAAAAPALRAASRGDVLAGVPVGLATQFGTKANAPDARAFTRDH